MNLPQKIETIKEQLIHIKTKFLDLGKVDEEKMRYENVVKEEKNPKTQINNIPVFTKEIVQEKYQIVKRKFLNLGKKDTKALVYTEVVKTEQESLEKSKQLAQLQKESIKIARAKSDAYKIKLAKNTKIKTEINTKTQIKSKVNSKKITTILKDKTAKKSTKKTKKTTKTQEKIALYTKDIKKTYGEVDQDLLVLIVKNLGPSVFNKNAELVSCDDNKELATVRQNFLINKLNVDASKGVLDAAIADVCEELKTSKKKYRATFYYSLAKKFKKESALS